MLSSIVMHRNCRELDVVINEIVWEDQTAVFLLLPVLTFTVYNYTVEPPESYHPKCQDPVVSHGRNIIHLQELRWGPYMFFSEDNLHCFACNFLVFTVWYAVPWHQQKFSVLCEQYSALYREHTLYLIVNYTPRVKWTWSLTCTRG